MANILEVKGLTTRVSGFTILNNLDFSIEENELRVKGTPSASTESRSLPGPVGIQAVTANAAITTMRVRTVVVRRVRWADRRESARRPVGSGRGEGRGMAKSFHFRGTTSCPPPKGVRSDLTM